MRFKIDDNLPVEVAELLEQQGHDATTVMDEGLGGGKDPRLAVVCREERRALVTLDTDFADIRAYPPELHSGLIVLRLSRQDKPYVLGIARRLVRQLSKESAEPVEGRLWIVEDVRIRIRG